MAWLNFIGMDGGVVGGPGSDVAHLHEDECHHRGQHEAGKAQQKNAVNREQRRGKHHQKSNRGEKVIIAVAARRKQTQHHHKQHQVHRRVEKTAREKEIIRQINDHVTQG